VPAGNKGSAWILELRPGRPALSAKAGGSPAQSMNSVLMIYRPLCRRMRSDNRIAIVGTAGSGKTYAAKGFVKHLLESGGRVAIVHPLGCGGDCVRPPTVTPLAIRSSCSAAAMPTCRSPPKWARPSGG
jgi:hypothetical protein